MWWFTEFPLLMCADRVAQSLSDWASVAMFQGICSTTWVVSDWKILLWSQRFSVHHLLSTYPACWGRAHFTPVFTKADLVWHRTEAARPVWWLLLEFLCLCVNVQELKVVRPVILYLLNLTYNPCTNPASHVQYAGNRHPFVQLRAATFLCKK